MNKKKLFKFAFFAGCDPNKVLSYLKGCLFRFTVSRFDMNYLFCTGIAVLTPPAAASSDRQRDVTVFVSV